MGRQGQALIELLLVVGVLPAFLIAFLHFGHWFLTRQALVMAARYGASLYSSGRVPEKKAVERTLQYLRRHPLRLSVDRLEVEIGRQPGFLGRLHRLDRVKIRYPWSSPLFPDQRRWLEEVCVIRHAPSYWVLVGPPVRW